MDSFTLSTKSITQNRFSEFPDELVDQIFSYLPPKDVVRTCALSKRWRCWWTSFNFISFDFDPWNEEEEQGARFLDMIKRELLIPDNEYTRIFRLHLDIHGPFYTYSNIMVSMSLVQLAHCTLKLLKSVCLNVNFLRLSHGTLQTISCAENFDADHVPLCFALTHLKVSEGDCDFSAAALLHIIEKSAHLQSLDLPDGLKLRILKEEEIHLLQNVVPRCLTYYLKTFRLSGFRGSVEEVSFLEYILKNASVLEQFSVHRSKDLKGKRG
ncbi:putative FBD-associated F-box protein At5g22720 [Herrania umbratica]|uniref:FBD-associated F-box protein At5g22720 n=1 Tax=Herrania umbratica TaxID=108875 RepID=A0A6J1AKG0_9ROSI|nr:putative FBD-associated F-box protein At5g22720 [Herrania umbratica]